MVTLLKAGRTEWLPLAWLSSEEGVESPAPWDPLWAAMPLAGEGVSAEMPASVRGGRWGWEGVGASSPGLPVDSAGHSGAATWVLTLEKPVCVMVAEVALLHVVGRALQTAV